ncbi:TetR/AcrR family transcriptional regulator [Bordetella petrii]|uniref:TetR/AcrR family transcriptional regulator n=1 Tax=Bordetella petrii TaxID=94624 RepID=UPI001E569A7C|nr:TetR/AcrR family transcriptional regulator [Bordetella petrii]MCD0504505.1 TetR/AcrR family transcriptional regulator [Bordetella petrii]
MSSEPAIVRRPPTKGARTRQRLLDIASIEFARNGYERTRVSDVAAKAAVTQPVFYQYFGSKKAIYDELVELFAKRMRKAVEQAKLPDDTPASHINERVRHSVQGMLAALQDNPSLTKIGFQQAANANTFKEELVDLIAVKVKTEQQAGLLRRDVSPYWFSQAFVGILERYAMLDQNAADTADQAAFIANLLMDGIRAPAVGAAGSLAGEMPADAGRLRRHG